MKNEDDYYRQVELLAGQLDLTKPRIVMSYGVNIQAKMLPFTRQMLEQIQSKKVNQTGEVIKVFRAKLDEAGMTQSMSRVGRCIDNGPMEGFWGILKSEMYYLRKFSSEDELIAAVEDYLMFYNTRRYQRRLGCMTPLEFHFAYAA